MQQRWLRNRNLNICRLAPSQSEVYVQAPSFSELGMTDVLSSCILLNSMGFVYPYVLYRKHNGYIQCL